MGRWESGCATQDVSGIWPKPGRAQACLRLRKTGNDKEDG
jgi:hypothetical protein